MRPFAAAIVLLGLLAAACGGGGSPSASPTPADAPVTPLSGTRACDPQDLGGVFNAPAGLAGLEVDAGVAFFNASASDCMLAGLPGVELLDNRKNPLAADTFPLCDEPASGCPPEYPVLLVASRTNAKPLLAGASVALKWTAPAASSPCDSPLQAGFLQVSIPGGQVMVPVNPGAVKPRSTMELCGGILGVGRFESISVDFDTLDKYTAAGLPTPTPTPFIDHTVRPCTASDVVGVFGGANALTGGQLLGYLAFGNRSDTACRLEGRPGIDLLDIAGSPMVLAHKDFCFGGPCVAQSVIVAAHSDAVQPRQSTPGTASLELYWPTYGSEGPPCASPPAAPAATVRVILPEGVGTVDVPVGAEQFAPCHTLGVGVFQATH